MGIPVAMISAIYGLCLATGVNRVVKGARVSHVCGDPSLGPAKDHAYGRQIVWTALTALCSPVNGPTLFDPSQTSMLEESDAS